MNTIMLSKAVRNMAEDLNNGVPRSVPNTSDTVELLRVLARMIEGRTLESAFGAPGDWGYDSPIGKALAERGILNVPSQKRAENGVTER